MTVTELTDLKTTINWLLENGEFEDKETSYNIAMNSVDILEKQLSIPLVSNCTTFNNRKFIRPVFDGISTAVTQYQVVDELGQFWFQGTKEDCDQFLYSC